jgi:hypothetical protein
MKNKKLINLGNGDSSEGSDSAPSEDNMNPNDLIKNLPVVDKALKTKIKQIDTEKKSPTKPKQFNIVRKPVESPAKPKIVVKVVEKP